MAVYNLWKKIQCFYTKCSLAHRQMEVNNSCVLMDIPELLFMPTAAITTKLIHDWSNLLEMSTVMDYLLR